MIKIVEKGEHKPRMADGVLYITVQGESPAELNSLGAKKAAYDERFKHGLGVAGVEAWTGSFLAGKVYLRTFRLVPGL
jgi:hypothetical protein